MTSRNNPPSAHTLSRLVELPDIPPSFAEFPAPVVPSEEEELARMRSLIPTEEEERVKARSFRRYQEKHEAEVRKMVRDLLDAPRRDAKIMRGLRRSGWPFSDAKDAVQPPATVADGDETPI